MKASKYGILDRLTRLFILTNLLLISLSACQNPLDQPIVIPTPEREVRGTIIPPSAPTSVPLISTPVTNTVKASQPTSVPQSERAGVALAYLKAWEAGKYGDMYDLLSQSARDAITKERFVTRYQNIAEEATIQKVSTRLLEVKPATNDQSPKGSATFTVTLETAVVGPITQDNVLSLVKEDSWRIDWAPNLIFKEITGTNLIHLFLSIHPRGQIRDRMGAQLTADDTLVTIGVVPERIKDEGDLLQRLSSALKVPSDTVKSKYVNAGRPDWFMPIREYRLDDFKAIEGQITSIPGVSVQENRIRGYPFGAIAAQTLGYLNEISAKELETMAFLGYREGDQVGKQGLERWGEKYLAGQRGGSLTVITPAGEIVERIQRKDAEPAYDLQTTLDLKLQQATEKALGDQVGAVVVMDPKSGDVLSLVSHPSFNPAEISAGMTVTRAGELLQDPKLPFLNRTTQNTYPPAALFQLVTMATAVEKGWAQPDQTFACGGSWTGLGGGTPLQDPVPAGHAQVNLVQGFAEGCKIPFYELGKTLFAKDPKSLSAVAMALGMGRATGIWQFENREVAPESGKVVGDEEPGRVPGGDPSKPVDLAGAVNMAVGQGDLKVTPLQVATWFSAIANGGTLYGSRLVSQGIQSGSGTGKPFATQNRGKISLSPATLELMRSALREAVNNPKGRGQGAKVPGIIVAGAPALAEVATGKPQAWFAGYAPAEDPKFVVVVTLANADNADQATAIFRQVLQAALAK
ncbi:MAG: hypothetical protein EXR62_00920 [Chloroflexi bacterium]|nr:hypothetical protein [Chloroflexota bacterium]